MFRLEDTEIANAVDRCRELHPTVRVVAFGEYTVAALALHLYMAMAQHVARRVARRRSRQR